LRSETIQKYEPPVSPTLADQLISFWEEIFQTSSQGLRPVLRGMEKAENRDVVYTLWDQDQLVGTSHLTYGLDSVSLGGLGEVATHPRFRKRGIADLLCRDALNDFSAAGGEALFLGTVNPAATRVYQRLGWKRLAGTTVMANVVGAETAEDFLVDYFRGAGPARIEAATPGHRVPMIPLLVMPHDWKVLDALTGMSSTRYVIQNSCMGLYPRYEALRSAQNGTWFGARTPSGRLVGLCSLRMEAPERAQVDGFTRPSQSALWVTLLESAMTWAGERGARRFTSRVCLEDEEKLQGFESLGFRRVESAQPFALDHRQVRSVSMRKE
jgi:GNAT superfamily N-acetyltransferase